MKKIIFTVATVALTLTPIVEAQTRSTDDSTGVRPLVGTPVVPFTHLPPTPTVPSSVIPYTYGLYGTRYYTTNDGVASFVRSGNSVVVSVIGAVGAAVNQSPPVLVDTSGNAYYPSSTNCYGGLGSCSATYNVAASATPSRLYVYWQGPERHGGT